MNEQKSVSSIVIVAITAVCSLILISSLIAMEQRSATAETPTTVTPIPSVDSLLDLSRFPHVARVGPAQQMVYGPHICTAFGDPFSPWNSPWAPGPYTYQYTVVIPPDYPHDILRVELFDPDSINTITQTVQVYFSQTAVAYDPDRFPPAGVEMTCPTDRRDHCILETGELEIVAETNRAISEAQINPYWYVRTDANRGAGPGYGNGLCAIPATYTPGYNTQTVYDLHYYAVLPNGDIPRISLGQYTGQVNDGFRDNGDHQTDMRWVSPGGTQLPDQPAPVPADFGSFEIDLTSDVPDIWVDPATGNRHIWLDITSVSGASLNEFHLWAGPLYPNLASDGNIRNLQIVNFWPLGFDSAGVEVKALRFLPQVSHEPAWAEKPLLTVGPEYAGSTIFFSAFDLDAGSQPPLVFSFDTLAFSPADNDSDGIDHSLTDWALSFGGTADDNSEGRCFAGGDGYNNECDNQWISPPYTITLPHDLDCDYQDPDVANCTPFYGGTLSVRYRVGFDDAAVWERLWPPPTVEPDPTIGCSAFPIAPQRLIRSVTPPGSGGPNPYPHEWEFSYPATPPAYEQFFYHLPDVQLPEAGSGTIYRAWLNEQDAAFLRWNVGISNSSLTLVNSLLWPGNSRDYTDHGDSGQPATPLFPYVVRGYVDPLDNTDISLHRSNWISLQTGDVNNQAVRDALNSHIDRGRLLRLPVWGDLAGSGSSSRIRVFEFGLFQLHGYNLAGTPSPWLLLEFVSWDDSCGWPEPIDPTPTPTMTATATITTTATPTATYTVMPSPTAMATATSTPSPTATATSTAVPTTPPTATATPAITASPTHAPVTLTPTPGPSPTQTPWVTLTPSATATAMPFPTATASSTAVPTTTATATATPTAVPPPTYYLYLPFIQRVGLSFVYEQNTLSEAFIAYQEKGE